MVVLSKSFFYERLNENVKCHDIHTWSSGCFKANRAISYTLLSGCFQFFLPIYIAKTILSYKKVNGQFLRNILSNLVRSQFYGFLFGSLALGNICIMCKLTGRIYYYNLTLLTGIVSGLSLLVETEENKILDTIIFFNMVVEAAFNNLDYFGYFKSSKQNQIAIFMVTSAILMNFLQNSKKQLPFIHFWFYTPYNTKRALTVEDESKKSCGHSGSCLKYTSLGLGKYFLLGYAVSVLKQVIPRMGTFLSKPKRIPPTLFSERNVKYGMFFGSYVGIYRYVTCYLMKNTTIVPGNFHGAIAGLLSGVSYAISPDLQILVIAITTLFQIFFSKIKHRFSLPKRSVLQQMLFMGCNGILFHNRIVCPESCPPYYFKMLTICTGKVVDVFHKNLIERYFLS